MLRYRDFPFLAAVCLAGYFLLLAWPGLTTHFAPDDMQNIYTYWTAGPWKVLWTNVVFVTSFYRPMGGVFYLVMFKLFGFHPLPYRIVIFVLLCVNIGLFYCLARRLTGSREAAAFAVLVECFHAEAIVAYMSTSSIYESLCFLFLIGGLLYYVRIRQYGLLLSPRQVVVTALFFIAALDSKEMAVVFPAVLLLYELLYPGLRHRDWRRLIPIAVTGIMAVMYTAGKLFGADSLATLDAYRPVYTLTRFLDTTRAYAAALLLTPRPMSLAGTIALWGSLIGIAAIVRRRELWFGVIFAALAFLPLNFVTPREGFVLYIPLAGFGLFAGGLFHALLDWIAKAAWRPQAAAILFAGLMIFLWNRNSVHIDRLLPGLTGAQKDTWETLTRLEQMHPRVERGARVLFVNAPWTGYDMYFIAKLFFDDPTLLVVLRDHGHDRGDPIRTFDHEFRFEHSKLVQVR